MIRCRKGLKVGFIASCFDQGPHAGHVATLEEAKRHCDYLIVALQVNPNAERDQKNVPIPSISERYLQTAACRYVDEVIPYETERELYELICLVWPDIRFLGEDYKDGSFTGQGLDIEIHFCKRRHRVSSSGRRAEVWAREDLKREQEADRFRDEEE